MRQFRKETGAALDSYNEALKLFRQVGDKLGELWMAIGITDLVEGILKPRVEEAKKHL